MAWIIAHEPDVADDPGLIGPFPDRDTAAAYATSKRLNDGMDFEHWQCPCQLVELAAPYGVFATDADKDDPSVGLPPGDWKPALPPGATE